MKLLSLLTVLPTLAHWVTANPVPADPPASSKYEVLGTMEYPLHDIVICNALRGDANLRKQVKVAHVTLSVLKTCQLYEENYPNLKKLYVFVSRDAPGTFAELVAPRPSNYDGWVDVDNASVPIPEGLPAGWPSNQFLLWNSLSKIYKNVEEFDVMTDDGAGILVNSLFDPLIKDRFKVINELIDSGKLNVQRTFFTRYPDSESEWNLLTLCFAPMIREIPVDAFFNVKDCVKTFVDRGLSMTKLNPYGESPLFFAAFLPTKDTLVYMVERMGLDNFLAWVQNKDELASSGWHRKNAVLASADGSFFHSYVPRSLISLDKTWQSFQVNTAYRKASETKELPFYYLLSIVKQLDESNGLQKLASSVVAAHWRADLMLDALMAHPSGKALLSVVDKEGQTVLHKAVFVTTPEVGVVVKKLIESKQIDVNAKDNDGDTALLLAARFGTLAAVQAMVDGGVDTTIKSVYGLDALYFAVSRYNKEYLIWKALVDGGVDFLDTYETTGWLKSKKNSFLNAMENLSIILPRGLGANKGDDVQAFMTSVLTKLPSLLKKHGVNPLNTRGLARMMDALNSIGNKELIVKGLELLPKDMQKWFKLVEREEGKWGMDRTIHYNPLYN